MKKKFFILWFLGILSTVAVIPYAFDLQKDILVGLNLSVFTIALISIAQTALLSAVAIFFGLKLSKKLNFSLLPVQEKAVSLGSKLRSAAAEAIPYGLGTAFAIFLADRLFSKYTPQLTSANTYIDLWKKLLASLYGGVMEEILMRLFLLSLFAWLLGKLAKNREPIKTPWVIWSAIAASAIIFGLGHLPATSAITDLSPIVVARAILLNGIGGLVFGWLYWKRSLAHAMFAHFITDLGILIVLPLLIK